MPKLEELVLTTTRLATRAQGPRGGGWEGRAAGAQDTRPRRQPAFSTAKDAWAAVVKGGLTVSFEGLLGGRF